MSNGTVVFTTSAHEFQQLLNRTDKSYRQAEEIEALKSECQDLKQRLIFIGKDVYESDGIYNVWSISEEKPWLNDALKYAKALADKESK